MRLRSWAPPAVLAVVFVALRGPSLVEPIWYSDEGTYADIATALLHGGVLYRDVWDNKPPGIYWLTTAVVWLFPIRRATFPIAAAVVVALGAIAVAMVGRRAAGRSGAFAAALVFIVLLSLPSLEGDLWNAEVVGAVFVLWGLVAITGDDPRRWQLLLGGGLIGMAVLTKAVFVLDLGVAGAVPFLAVGPALALRARRAVCVLAGAAAVVGTAALVLWRMGSLGAALDVVLHQDVHYVQLSNGATGADSTLLLAGRVGFVLGAGGLLGLALARRQRRWPAIAAWWLTADIAGAMLSARGFPHYAHQAVGALSLTSALAASALWKRRNRRWRWLTPIALVAAWMAVELIGFIPRAELAIGNRQPIPHWDFDTVRTDQLSDYYRLGWRRWTTSANELQYEKLFPADVPLIEAAVRLFREESKPGDRVFVWANVHWTYALSDRVPAGRYVSLNAAYRTDPGSEGRLRRELAAHPPVVLVDDGTMPGDVQAAFDRLGYSAPAPLAGGFSYRLGPGRTTPST